jgi:hypothetical protein
MAVKLITTILFIVTSLSSSAEQPEIPKCHSGLEYDSTGQLIYIDKDAIEWTLSIPETTYTLSRIQGNPRGTDSGLIFNFQISDLKGHLIYGFYPDLSEMKHQYPVFYHRSSAIEGGRAEINIKKYLTGRYDFINWQTTGRIKLGYRVVNEKGRILYDGKIMLAGKGPFIVDTSIIEGPFVNLLEFNSVTISFETNFPATAEIIVDNRSFGSSKESQHHEIKINELEPDRKYEYEIICGEYSEKYHFRTAPRPGTRKPFTFAYASDGRANIGGGERSIFGTNAYMMKKIGAVCGYKNACFMQFTGDMINGYSDHIGDIELQYANWKRSIEPFASYIPFIAGMGNHEHLAHFFIKDKDWLSIDRFPYETESGETIFAGNFVNPPNGPDSEDGSQYDPNRNSIDFPNYKENVFYYIYDNMAMVVLNSDYWLSVTIEEIPEIGGNLHGYIMDNQLDWLKETLETLEADNNIDHIFVTFHTPLFPCGGHVADDMWYGGNNNYRSYITGKPVAKGIIERRDQLLDLMINQSSKVVATLTGDEHNYYRLHVDQNMPIYPDNYKENRLILARPFWHINNGAAGAPYYGQEDVPWSENLKKFSTQNAVIFFHIDGKSIEVEVINPDTMELIDRFKI